MKTIIPLLVFLVVAKLCVARKNVNFLRLANCPEYKNYTVFVKNVVFTRNKQGKTVSMRFSAIFKKEVKRLKIIVTLRKCDNSGNLDTCEYYMKDFKISNVCDVMSQKNQIWSTVQANSNFPTSCPIAAGTYYLNETELDNDVQLSLTPIPIALWKVKFFTYDSGNNDIMVCCTDLEINVFNSRRN